MSDDPLEYYEGDGAECPNCGGEGWVSHCFEEWACMHPDEGCDLCMRRCDWCNPPKPAPSQPSKDGGE
jgi:hypothetical protein